ncbi:hypothetical protein PENCOP_c003G03294 [Penicillium coprophilum]|uniref:NmrA-like domain-containing protein n=1 Tax=Penicillium coprophilum TaxID=36646 RepID=A0A1V6UX57_9EURO|nr:hypothetical protein PENCOP_c003G03294 [Penicillium coprophilum]
MSEDLILVTGATGTQGRATIRALSRLNVRVRALVRSITSPVAQELRNLQVELAQGDNPSSLGLALCGVTRIYLNVSPSPTDPEAETRHARNVIEAATQPGSTVRTLHESFPGWENSCEFSKQYWLSKATNVNQVRTSGIYNCIILRPCTFMSNYLQPLAPFFFPELLSTGVFRTALTPNTPTMLIGPDDVGRFAAIALTNSEQLHGREIDIASEALTPPEIAAALAEVAGRPVDAQYMEKPEIDRLARESHVIWAQTYFNEQSCKVDVEKLTAELGIRPVSFLDFLNAHQRHVKASFGTL